MICGQSVLAIVPARGGSKGVLRKNIRKLFNKPLICWSIETAQRSKYIDRVILSSEDHEIITTAKHWGCDVPFVRPNELAQDDTPGIEPVLHAITEVPGYDYVVLLQPTSPLRTADDIDACIEMCVFNKANSCVSVVETDKSPYWTYSLDKDNRMIPLLKTDQLKNRRQELPKTFALNGAIYTVKTSWLNLHKKFVDLESLAYLMPQERSVDIDTEFDFKLAEFIMNNNVTV